MGSEQSQPHGNAGTPNGGKSTAAGGSRSGPPSHGASAAVRPFGMHNRPMSATAARLQRGNTIAVSGQSSDGSAPTTPQQVDSRPASPPMSVCSDSDLPYISYTDKPIGDSPKLRNKGSLAASASRAAARNSMYETTSAARRPTTSSSFAAKPRPASSTFVVVQEAPQKVLDPDLQRIQSIPQFLPVMRGSHHSLPTNRDPEVLERLQPGHLTNMCQRMQTHLHLCAAKVSGEQMALNARIRDVDNAAGKVLAAMGEKQKLYATYADHFAKVRHISAQLSRCAVLLQQNLEAVEQLNGMLEPDNRLEPFVWPATAVLKSTGVS